MRQALNYAVNRPALIQLVTFGAGKPMTSYMSSSTPLFDKTLKGFPYDPAKAKALLSAAGFPNGIDVSIIVTSGSATGQALATTLQQMWGAVGVRLKIEQLDAASNTARYRANDFQMRASGWTDDIADPSEITSYFAVAGTTEAAHTGFSDPTIEKLFVQSQQETNKAKRAAQYKQIQTIFNNASPNIYLYETPYPVALAKFVKGFNQIPLGNNIFEATWLDK